MANLHGSPEEMQKQARTMARSLLVEIANRNDAPQAMKARAELDRRDQVKVHWILGISGAAALAAIVGAVLTATN